MPPPPPPHFDQDAASLPFDWEIVSSSSPSSCPPSPPLPHPSGHVLSLPEAIAGALDSGRLQLLPKQPFQHSSAHGDCQPAAEEILCMAPKGGIREKEEGAERESGRRGVEERGGAGVACEGWAAEVGVVASATAAGGGAGEGSDPVMLLFDDVKLQGDLYHNGRGDFGSGVDEEMMQRQQQQQEWRWYIEEEENGHEERNEEEEAKREEEEEGERRMSTSGGESTGSSSSRSRSFLWSWASSSWAYTVGALHRLLTTKLAHLLHSHHLLHPHHYHRISLFFHLYYSKFCSLAALMMAILLLTCSWRRLRTHNSKLRMQISAQNKKLSQLTLQLLQLKDLLVKSRNVPIIIMSATAQHHQFF